MFPKKGWHAKAEKKPSLAMVDKQASEYFRKRAMLRRGGCEKCGAQKHDIIKENGDIFPAWKQLHWAHYIRRAKMAVRWDESNGLGLCAGCHRYIDDEAIAKVEFFKSVLGETEHELLIARSMQRPDSSVRQFVLQDFKERIKILDEEMQKNENN